MITIPKYLLNHEGVTTIFVSENCAFLKVDTQGAETVAWVEVDTEAEFTNVNVVGYYTGAEISDEVHEEGMYLGTTTKNGLVSHFYAVTGL